MRQPLPIVLSGCHVRLEPLTLAHAPDLFAALQCDPTIWQWRSVAPPATVSGLEAQIAASLELQETGLVVAFAQVAQDCGRAIGATTYMNISVLDGHLEIGNTWIGKPWQRTGINTEAKYLLLAHAFDDLQAVRVQLKTDARNVQSQRAIERLGAHREGVLRKHMLARDGFIRDTVMYSIIAPEWPAIAEHLRRLLDRDAEETPV